MTYNAVKAAEISLGKSLAQQLAPSNIRVNSVSPGSILFEGGSWWKRQQQDPAGIAEFVTRELPFGRFGRPEEVGQRRRVPGVAEGELDQRHVGRRGRLSEPIVLSGHGLTRPVVRAAIRILGSKGTGHRSAACWADRAHLTREALAGKVTP